MFKEQCGVIFGSCARWQCAADAVVDRPWCPKHEILTEEQVRQFNARQASRPPFDQALFVETLLKWRRKLLQGR